MAVDGAATRAGTIQRATQLRRAVGGFGLTYFSEK